MKRLVISILLLTLFKIGFGQDTLQLQDFNGFRVEATEFLINGDTVKSIDPLTGQIMKFDGNKWAKGNETDPAYTTTDSTFIKTGVRSWNSSLAKKITTSDTTRWGMSRHEVTVINSVTSYNLPFTLKTNAMIFYNGYLLDPNRWAGINSNTLLLYLEPKTYDTLRILN